MYENNCLDFTSKKLIFPRENNDLLLQSVYRYLTLCSFFVFGFWSRFMFMCLFMVRDYHQYFSL